MAILQKEFKEFHNEIKLGTYEENKSLRDKRDLLINELTEKLKDEKVPDTDSKLTFTKFNQGSYAMNTGIKPRNDDYDIDVGIIFDITNEEYDSNKLKKLVRDKLDTQQNPTVVFNRPCITVKYSDGYHVDLAIYAGNNSDYHIAWGKEHSSKNREWYKSEPKKLTKWVDDVSNRTNESEQFRRCVRYLKNWKTKKFSCDGNAAPPSIGLTIQARNAFGYRSENDIDALINIVSAMKADFSGGIIFERSISVPLPVAPYKNVYYKMTSNQIDKFYEKLDALLEILETARDEDSAHEASKLLRKVFDGFPLVEDSKASNTAPIVLTGNNA